MLAAKKKAGEEDSLRAVCLSGHAMFDESRVQACPRAVIHGACLWRRPRVGDEVRRASGLTLPKTKLGSCPKSNSDYSQAGAGTRALPKLVGLTEGPSMILQGKEVRPDKAKKIGLVDAVCDPAALEDLAVQTAVQLSQGKKKQKRSRGCAGRRRHVSFGRDFVFKKRQEQVG